VAVLLKKVALRAFDLEAEAEHGLSLGLDSGLSKCHLGGELLADLFTLKDDNFAAKYFAILFKLVHAIV
jgi:hypothetical protein